jgi:heme-degrading monooxygenase HmoA
MIARIWTGTVRNADADEYADYIRDTGLREYGETPGNRGAWMLRRDHGALTEFITLSLWDSEEAIRGFAGDDIEVAVYFPEDERFLVDRGGIRHYVVTAEIPPFGGPVAA